MSFTDKQRRALRAKLSWRHVKTRASGGGTIAYVEGWHAIAEANRIFGCDGWDRTTLSPRCLWSEVRRGLVACFYSTKVRITVRAGASLITREGIGTGFGQAPHAEAAHEIALKAAETDATKRALATFGNPFGLALYDKDQTHVTKPPKAIDEAPPQERERIPDLVLVYGARRIPYGSAEAYAGALQKAIRTLTSVDDVYAFWEANLDGLRDLRRRSPSPDSDPVDGIVAALKGRARALGYGGRDGDQAAPLEAERSQPAGKLAMPKEQRIRSKDHLAHVARQPCVVCGRRPAQAHHLRFAQPRAMSMKVSDEFCVPLCVTHHDALHRVGDEQAWWARHGIIEPLKIAARLWAESRGHPHPDDDDTSDGSGSRPADGATPASGGPNGSAAT